MSNYDKIKEQAEKEKERILEILNRYTTEMEGYSYSYSNPGIPEDRYEDVADDIINEKGD